MAIYHCSVKPIKRSAGRSATAAAAYRSATLIADTRTGERHDYSRRGGVLHSEIIAPANAPDWAHDHAALWNAAETAEKRKDACVAREIEVSLPHELDGDGRTALVRSFARELVDRYGVAIDLAVHVPHPEGDIRNHHVHFLLTTRAITPEGLAPRKSDLELSDSDRRKRALPSRTAELKAIRANWAEHVNRALERAGRAERVDHRSFEDRGIEKVPTQHQGPTATGLERAGNASRIGEKNRSIRVWNRERYEAQRQMSWVDAAIRQERARLDAGRRRTDGSGSVRGQGGGERSANDNAAPPFRAAAQAGEDGGLHGEWANVARARLQDAQLEARAALMDGQQRARDALAERLEAHYRPGLDAARRRLAEIKARQRQDGLKGALYRRSPLAGRDRAQAEALEKSIANAQWREHEQHEALRHRQEEALSRLEQRQREQREALERQIEARALEVPSPAPSSERESSAWERIQEKREHLRSRGGGRDIDREPSR